jgi:hypothetical protein
MTAIFLRSLVGSAMGVAFLWCANATAADKDETISLGEGKLVLKAPEKWVRREPKVRIIEHEFAVEGKKENDPGRVTVMGAGGSIEQNIDRWIGQFAQPDGSRSKDKAKVEKKKVAGIEVHLVDISGTYKDMPAGPFAGGKTIERNDYRMLAAIIAGGQNTGNYFIKFYGPADVVKENEKAFNKMIESLEKK